MLTLFCSRPHEREVDFRTARFVVGKACGLDVDGRHLEMGDEIPRGALTEEALRQIYQTPLRLIETIEFAFANEELRAECERHRTCIDPAGEILPAQAKSLRLDFDALDFTELVQLCKLHRLPHVGNRRQLTKRLAAALGN